MSLGPEQFAAFFRAANGHPPFPWQEALAAKVCAGPWPDVLALPTGSGKTSALDVAVFAMAVDAARPPTERRAPRRVLLVVDRRVVVSQAATHGRALARAIRDGSGILATVRGRLLSLTGGEGDALQWAELRGGMLRDDAWARRPDQPLVGASTVDQVGSRLLFRGYGAGRRMSSVHAGLMGNDLLLLLDEVHLSEPFRQTTDAVVTFFRGAERPVGGRFRVVEMSATPSVTEGRDRFDLTDKDRDDPVLAARLLAAKPAELDSVKVSARAEESDARGILAARCAEHAARMVAAGRRRVLVVVNRVDTARRVAEALRVPCELVTGRMRPLDRDRWLRQTGPRLTVEGRDDGDPLVVVSTQCIEAGADFDFDGLVTECASLDALQQRFGRLNRQGRQPGIEAVIVMRTDLAKVDDDPVYGDRMAATWAWFGSLGGSVDFGIAALDEVLRVRGGSADLVSKKSSAPVLLPGHLDLWAQTSERPFPDPEPAPFLHGPDRSPPEVQVVWRSELTEALLVREREEAIAERLSACPPGSLEAVTLPIHAVRNWLRRQDPVEVADVEGVGWEEGRPRGIGRPAVRWSGDGEVEVVDPDGLRGGDTVVVPSTYGGLWRDGWAPESADPVSDLGDEVQLQLRGRFVRRLLPGLLPAPPGLSALEESDGREEVAAWAAAAGIPELGRPDDLRLVAIEPAADAPGYLVARSAKRFPAQADEVATVDDSASFLGREVALERHLGDVRRWARTLATNVGMSAELVHDLTLAGWLHDVGKADPRFQQMLVGGSPVRAAATAMPLAKSALGYQDRRATEAARKRSGYPRGLRHELQSVVMAEDHIRAEAHDPDLVLHLVASHHGWCRPFPPALVDARPVDVTLALGGREYRASSDHRLARLDSGIADRFWRLNRRYGWWGLAWLEAVLRLADHRASEEEST